MTLLARQVHSLSATSPWHVAPVLPRTWVVLETSLHRLVRDMLNGAASRLRSGISTMASSRLSYWTMAA